MIKKTIAYVDYDGNEREEDFYFNLSKAELTELQLGTSGGLQKMIENIIKTKDIPRIIEIFKKIIIASYGVKSPDGRRFMKSSEITDEFTQTEAYSILFMELSTDAEKAAEFIAGVIPADLKKEFEEAQKNDPKLAALTSK